MKKVLFITFALFAILGIGLIILYNTKYKTTVEFMNNVEMEINTNFKVKALVKKVNNAKIKNKNDIISFDSLGIKKVKIIVVNKFNKEKNYIVNVKIIDTISPIIECDDKIVTTEGNKVDLLKNVKVSDNSLDEITAVVEGDYDFNKPGEYELKYVAKDSSGNIKEESFVLVVKKKEIVKTQTSNTSKYYVRINKTQNVVMVYGKDENNEYTNLIKTFVASAGNNTPLGIFTATDKVEALSLKGNVWGHYTMRIVNSIWFHSVPYYTKADVGEDGNLHWNDLEYEEYNKLGTLASAGCIRLAVIDAKWIYDNIPRGTKVEIYESDTLPEGVTKPNSIKIDINSENRGWDPTDPDSENPWHN